MPAIGQVRSHPNMMIKMSLQFTVSTLPLQRPTATVARQMLSLGQGYPPTKRS
jgi:hypothetical protein